MTRRMHPGLGWTLLASLAAGAWALWWPATPLVEPASTDAAMQPARPATDRALVARRAEPGSAIAPGFAADSRDALLLSPAAHDPFNPAPPPAPPALTKATPEPARSEPAPTRPPPPTAPPMTHRVVGRFQSPDGQWLVFLQDGPQTVAAAAGVALVSGYVVESVTPGEIRLRHPLAEQPVSLPMPVDNAP